MRILLIYYHPVVWDLAQTFKKLGHSVVIGVNPTIKDNYGTGADIIAKAQQKYGKTNVIPLALGIFGIRSRGYDLVGCDGVFDGDKEVMDACLATQTPFFNIQGYPNVSDEPSENILSFGCFTPIVQYNREYPSEGHKKQIDWKNIAEDGKSDGKNICVFYPNFWEFKEKICSIDSLFSTIKNHATLDIHNPYKGFISLIQGYERWNKFSYQTFEQIQKQVPNVKNLEGKSHEECFQELQDARGLLHLKWADQPGIALLEAMLSAKPILTLNSFVYASINPEVLIHHYNSIIADDIDELIFYMKEENKQYTFLDILGKNAYNHAMMLTNFDRQRDKLERFINRCGV